MTPSDTSEAPSATRSREPQYEHCHSLRDAYGPEQLGTMSSQSWYDDPKRLTFVLARYKFVAQMFSGREQVLEVGCGDAFASRIVCQAVGSLTVSDFDPAFIADALRQRRGRWQFETRVHDLLAEPMPGLFNGIYALDVLEHIPQQEEARFMENLLNALEPQGAMILGMPSLESQPYASPLSKAGHVNCKSQPDFAQFMQRYFHNVFMFSMNDEVLHTGYHKMSHYLLALGCGKRA